MTPPPVLFHSLLRPAILQILRAAGYSGAKAAVVDSLTDLAARYLSELCRMTAVYAAHNGHLDGSAGGVAAPGVVDLRMALQHVGALLPERLRLEQVFVGQEDARGTGEFVSWAEGTLSREIRRIATEGGDEEAADYLDALKRRHGKTDDDGSKYAGTLLGRSNEHGDVLVEGGKVDSIRMWNEKLQEAAKGPPRVDVGGNGVHVEDDEDSGASSGLSSLGDRDLGEFEDMEF